VLFARLVAIAALSAYIVAAPAFAQRYSFDYFGQERGLANLTPECMVRDHTGYLWVGTQNGLFRYDGIAFRRFGRADGIQGETIASLHVTRSGELWAGTNQGLFRFDGRQFQRISLPAQIHSIEANAIVSDRNGVVYAGTDAGLAAGNTATGFRLIAPIGRQTVTSGLTFDTNERLWFWSGGRICTLDAGALRPASRLLDPSPNGFSAMLADASGRLWARSPRHLFLREAGSSDFAVYGRALPPCSDMCGLAMDRGHRLLVPTDLGLAREDNGQWTIADKAHGLMANEVTCVLQDSEGSVWLGLGGAGLARWRGYGLWRAWREGDDGLANDDVWSIERDVGGALWVGTDIGVQRWTGTKWEAAPVGNGRHATRIDSILPLSDGSLLFGSSSGLLVRYDPRTQSKQTYGSKDGLSDDHIAQMALDGNGTLIVSTRHGLVSGQFAGSRYRFEPLHAPDLPTPVAFSYRLFVDRSKNLWICGSSGLWRRDATNRWTHWGSRDGIEPAPISVITQTPDGAIWIGYRGDVGLARLTFPGGHLAVRRITKADGIASNLAMFLGTDSEGNLWYGSDNGVDERFEGAWRHSNRGLGLVWDDCNEKAFFADADGSVWIGTSLGLAHRSRMRYNNQAPPPVVLTSVNLGGTAGDPSDPGVIKSGNHTIEVGFSALTFTGGPITFRYRLLGVEREWNQTTQDSARYAGIQPGQHTFQVSARRGSGKWSTPISFSFRVEPAWWQSWSFRAAAVLGLVLLGILFWRRRINSMIAVQRKLEAAVNERTAELLKERQELAVEKERVEAQNREIERLLAETRLSMRYRSQFLANMSHEIRTPLSGVLGMMELALGSPLAPSQRLNLELASSSANALLSILNDILDFSKIEAGKLDFEEIPFDVCALVSDTVRLLEPGANEKGLDLRHEISGCGPELVLGDPGRLRQVLMNLLANALKFTERGEVVVQVDCEACSTTTKTYRFRVRDTGIGIPPELREHIFEAFQQGDGSVSRKYGGAGLGLSISSQLVAIMGGVLRVDSEIDQGSTFEFSVQFPIVKDFEETGSRSAAAGDSADCDPLDILVVEDNSVNRRVIEGVLVRLGHGVTLAEDGIEAERILADREFQLAFVDVQMPVMDGLELTKRIREREAETGDHLPVVALTASAMKGDREMCFACGMDDYLPKPINFEHLRAVIAKYQRTAKRTATSER
jgi:signal transduction histidine kinase/ligand-binding sensor domain-containing protein/CheY-like chemotaxis protein